MTLYQIEPSSDFISDHKQLHDSLQCIRPHPVRKQLAVRAHRRIKADALAEYLEKFNVDQGCVDVDIVVVVVYSGVRLELLISMHTGIFKQNTLCMYR